MNLRMTVTAGGLGALGVFGLLRWRAYWNGTVAALSLTNVPKGWPFGEVLWRAGVRSTPVCILFCLVGLIALPGALLWSPGSEFASESPSWYDLVFALSGLIWLVAQGSVVLLNRPSWLVPPRFRGEPGAIEEWRQRRRRRSE